MTIQPEPYADPTYVESQVVTEPAVVAPAVVAQPAPVVERVVVPQTMHRSVARSYGRRYAFDSFLVGIVGLALLIIGLIAMTRAGFDGSMKEPVIKVLGFTHTATLGIIEAAFGVCLLLCAAVTSRAGAVFFGVILGVAAFVGAVQEDSFRRSLALESGFAWICVIAAVAVVLVSLLIPRVTTNVSEVEAI